MSEIVKSEGASVVAEKPATSDEDVKFPPLPVPTDTDFEDDFSEQDKEYTKNKFADLNSVIFQRLHCTACDRHLGASSRNLTRVRVHPMLRTLVCQTCHIFYNSGEFEKGDDGSELYCRWCGQGGQVFCCSDCPHVFCAKCIKRNLGSAKIAEIKSLDDWKCFKCNPDCLKHLRAVCWALFQYCKMRDLVSSQADDPAIREMLTKKCQIDETICCKNRKRNEKADHGKKKEESKKTSPTIPVTKLPPTIQVKKFASINLDDIPKHEKKPSKRSASPKNKVLFVKTPMPGTPVTRLLNPINVGPPIKKIKIASPMMNTIRYVNETRLQQCYPRIRPKNTINTVNISNNFNGFNNTNHLFTQLNTNPFNSSMENIVSNDNINLSLDNLTQGLDISAALSGNNNNDDVVCTPDIPMDSMNEAQEDNDDDVECITPGPSETFRAQNPPPLVPCGNNTLPLTSDNIIQMTDNDVTVNSVTGGLKFRVDPQTLSSNKMYRLPDGRVFAININPKMPGGYSATIVAVTDNASSKTVPTKGTTFAAKLSAVTSTQCSSTKQQRNARKSSTSKNNPQSKSKSNKSNRLCDLDVPVEWFRYNLTDAVDSLEYSLHRLQKLKKETSNMYLRTRSISEMKNLHKNLDRLLTTSSKRFDEIKDNLNNDLKQFILRKTGSQSANSDDDVEILSNADNDDPIFIDENSVESTNDHQEVDLTGAGSEHNESGEKEDFDTRIDEDTLIIPDNDSVSNVTDNCEIVENNSINTNKEGSLKCFENMLQKSPKQMNENNSTRNNEIIENEKPIEAMENNTDPKNIDDEIVETVENNVNLEKNKSTENKENTENDKSVKNKENNSDNIEDNDTSIEMIEVNTNSTNDNDESMESTPNNDKGIEDVASKDKNEATDENNLLNDKMNLESDKVQDSEISDELIESLLKDDNSTDCKD